MKNPNGTCVPPPSRQRHSYAARKGSTPYHAEVTHRSYVLRSLIAQRSGKRSQLLKKYVRTLETKRHCNEGRSTRNQYKRR